MIIKALTNFLNKHNNNKSTIILIQANQLSTQLSNKRVAINRKAVFSFIFFIVISVGSFATLPVYAQRPQILARNRCEKKDWTIQNMGILDDIRFNWHSRQLIKWSFVTYPKSTGLVFVSFIGIFALVVREETNRMRLFGLGFKETLHQTDGVSRRNDKLLVYDSSKAD